MLTRHIIKSSKARLCHTVSKRDFPSGARKDMAPRRCVVFGETRHLTFNLHKRHRTVCSLYKLNDCIGDAARVSF
jgi:hypothetical protein